MKIKVFEVGAGETWESEEGHRDGGKLTFEMGKILEERISAWLAQNPRVNILKSHQTTLADSTHLTLILTVLYSTSLRRKRVESFYQHEMITFGDTLVKAVNSARQNGLAEILHCQLPKGREQRGKAVAERILEKYSVILDRLNHAVDNEDKMGSPTITHVQEDFYLVVIKTLFLRKED